MIFLLGSAFFSGSETALFSLSKIQQKKLENTDKRADKRILKMLGRPRYLLITVLLGNTLVNMAISSFATLYALNLKAKLLLSISDSALIAIQIAITTIVILVFGEVIPKLLAWARSYSISRVVSIPLLIIGILLYPVLKLLEQFSLLISRKRIAGLKTDFTSEEFTTLIHSQNGIHSLEDHERKMLAGIFKLPKAEIREIFIPRVEMVALDETKSLDDLKQLLITSGYSRIPLFRNTIDDIVGIVFAKDILLYPEKKTIRELMRPAWFVTENMKIQTLLNQFRSRKSQIAIVVDEYGGTSGIITLEDILEELVGEIHDEYDKEESPHIQKVDENTYLVKGNCGIRELNRELNLDIDPDEYDNVADFMLDYFQRLPKVNEKTVYLDEFEFVIMESSRRRIKKIKIIRQLPNENELPV